MPGTVPAAIAKALALNVLGAGTPPSGLTADEQRAYDRLNFLYTQGIGYALEMGNRPQTLYGLADSPVALAAWMLDHDLFSYQDIASAFRGEPVGNLIRDEVLDNITLTWVMNTGISSGRLYWENTLDFFDAKGVTVPAAVSVFPRELYQAPRSWTEQAYPNLVYFNELDKGNHFAAWQEPELSRPRCARRSGHCVETAPGSAGGVRRRDPRSRRCEMSLFGLRRHAPLPAEGYMPGFDGATGWLNSPPLTAEDLRGKVVLVDFWSTPASTGCAPSHTSAPGPRSTRIAAWSWSASIRPSSRSSGTSTMFARPRRT
jgi:hypothetical protein